MSVYQRRGIRIGGTVAVIAAVVAALGAFRSNPAAPKRPASNAVARTAAPAPARAPSPPTVDLAVIQASPTYAQGKELFQNLCTLCHMENGDGQPGTVPSLHGAPIANGSADRFARLLLHGMEGPVVVKGVTYEGVMPPATFDEDESLAAVMTFVRNSWGNAAGAVGPDVTARVKKETAGRLKPWTAPELEQVK